MEVDQTILFVMGQAILIFGAIVTTYVKTQVAITRLQVMSEHMLTCYDKVQDVMTKHAAELHEISRRVEHIETIQQAACSACPLNKDNISRAN